MLEGGSYYREGNTEGGRDGWEEGEKITGKGGDGGESAETWKGNTSSYSATLTVRRH